MQREWAEDQLEKWPKERVAGFGVYNNKLKGMPQGPTTFPVPFVRAYEHGWCDFIPTYRGRGKTNVGAQPAMVSAYALGKVLVPQAEAYTLHVGFDDWIKVWIDSKEAYSGRHDKGFAEDNVKVNLPVGEASILVKLSNFDNLQWRNWAFAIQLEKQH